MNRIKVYKFFRALTVWVLILAVLIGMAAYLAKSLVSSCPVSGDSMEPNIHSGDTVYFYETEDIDYGDVVIFRVSETNTVGKLLIKRVIGLPGDAIKIAYSAEEDAYHVYRDGVLVGEENILAPMHYTAELSVTVPEGQFFFLGDNRNTSKDSHIPNYFGDLDSILGVVFLRYRDIKDFTFFFD